MARKRMVTRAIDVTTVSVMTLNVTTAEVKIIDYTYTGIFKDSDLLKQVQKQHDTFDLKHVSITETKVEQKLYGMEEQKFLEMAQELDEKRNIISEN